MTIFPQKNDTDLFIILALERIQQSFLAETQRNLEMQEMKGVVLRRGNVWTEGGIHYDCSLTLFYRIHVVYHFTSAIRTSLEN